MTTATTKVRTTPIKLPSWRRDLWREAKRLHEQPASQVTSDTQACSAGGSDQAGSSHGSRGTHAPTAAARRPKGRAA